MEIEYRFSERFAPLSGKTVEFDEYKASVGETLDIEITNTTTGWMVRYPAFTAAWAVICMWLEDWDDEGSRNSMTNFITGVVFVASMRLHDIDEQYLEDFININLALNKRNEEKGNGDGGK